MYLDIHMYTKENCFFLQAKKCWIYTPPSFHFCSKYMDQLLRILYFLHFKKVIFQSPLYFLKITFIISLSACFVSLCTLCAWHVCVSVCVWKTNFGSQCFAVTICFQGDWTQAVKLSGKPLSLPSHLAGPCLHTSQTYNIRKGMDFHIKSGSSLLS